MDDDRVTDADLAKLIELVSDATSAFIRGDMRRYLALITHTDDYTLIAPTGGETIQGFEISEERLTQMERFFKTGDATPEVVQTYSSLWSSASTARSAPTRPRTGRCGRLWCSAARDPSGGWRIGTPTRSSTRSRSTKLAELARG
jgi:hypothetical protein